MGVVDGQQVSAAVTNPAFIDANQDDVTNAKLGLHDPFPLVSGGFVENIQREHNSLNAFTGHPLASAHDAYPVWINNDVGASTNTLFARADALTLKFNATTGHKHTGAAGDAPPIDSATISGVPLKGYVLQGTDLTGVTGTSTDVSTEMTGKSPSANSGDTGVVVTAPVNKIIIRQATGALQDDVYVDGSGNVVYGRLTESAGVWTLSYFVNISGTETAYSFSASDVRWYYQELFNPLATLAPPPVYSEFASIPSDNATADVIDATTALKGKVQLSSAAAAAVGSTGTAGTANATVANADHVHAGVHSVSKSGSAQLLGDVTLTGSDGSSLTQVGQNIEISSPALSSSAAADVGSAGTVGVGTTSARADHVHRGVASFAKSGSAALYGAVTISAGTGISLNQVGQDVAISSSAAAGRAGRQSVTNGTTTQAITFSSSLGTTNYAANAQLVNVVDGTPQFQPVTITAKSATGFTASWNAPTDSANYVLDWTAQVDN